MRFVDLFAGIGGFHLGIKKAIPNAECVWWCDNDKHARMIYEKHFPGILNAKDIRKVDAKQIPDHDLLCAGFPCQSFSIAGKMQGFKDERGNLFFEIIRILRVKRPALILLENVKGLLFIDKGRTFKEILLSLEGLGYDCEWQVLNSKDFGVPQNRERAFIIGHLRGKSRPQIFPILGSMRSNTQRNVAAKKDVFCWKIGSNEDTMILNICPTLTKVFNKIVIYKYENE